MGQKLGLWTGVFWIILASKERRETEKAVPVKQPSEDNIRDIRRTRVDIIEPMRISGSFYGARRRVGRWRSPNTKSGGLGSSPSALTNNQPSKTSNPSRRFRLGVWGRTALDRLTPRPSPRRHSTQPTDLSKSGSRMRPRVRRLCRK